MNDDEILDIRPTRRGSCGDCKFYYPLEGGACRKNPAQLIPLAGPQGVQLISAWPPVKDSQWCGEFRSGNES